MDIEEFAKKVKPRAKRSRLAPFRAQILELKEKGFVAWQIRDWLETNGVKVTRQAVSQFIRQQENDETPKRRATDQTEKQKPPTAAGGKGLDDEKGVRPAKPEKTFVTKTGNAVKAPPTQQQLKDHSRSNFDLSQFEDEDEK